MVDIPDSNEIKRRTAEWATDKAADLLLILKIVILTAVVLLLVNIIHNWWEKRPIKKQ